MEKIFALLDTAVAVLLVVIALSVQLQENHRLTELLKKTESSVGVSEAACLRGRCNGLELAAHFGMLTEKREEIIIFAEKEYRYVSFCKEVLGLAVSPDSRSFTASAQVQEALKKRSFQIYQINGKWRVEE